eukprot:CAMPEP_0184040962 /NCGR_PEP_ID=MMETSP0955-20130417/60372_1 /TAXON_ID=627963 /ORGANISM="Aplanochytrium sp, Strain PBS07" /LENGTH=400 /DNA_ID=CAMNT_0026331019 /DNA_START=66 /DNA_END=1268 /DNA_ORIENTATION=+
MRHPGVSLKVLYPDDDILHAGHHPTSVRQMMPPLMEAGKEAELAYVRGISAKAKDKTKASKKQTRKFTQKEMYGKGSRKSIGDSLRTVFGMSSSTRKLVALQADNITFESSEDLENVELEVPPEIDDMPHIDKLSIAIQARFLSYAATRCTVSSSSVHSRTKIHTFMPMARPYDYGEIGDQCEFRWQQRDLEDLTIGPFLTTSEFLATQFFVLHLVPKRPGRDRFADSVGSCTISLTQAAFGGDIVFNEELHYNGQIIGLVRGRFRVLLDDNGWSAYGDDASSHPFNKNNIHSIPLGSRPASETVVHNIRDGQNIDPKIYTYPNGLFKKRRNSKKKKMTSRNRSKDYGTEGYLSPSEFQKRTRNEISKRKRVSKEKKTAQSKENASMNDIETSTTSTDSS